MEIMVLYLILAWKWRSETFSAKIIILNVVSYLYSLMD